LAPAIDAPTKFESGVFGQAWEPATGLKMPQGILCTEEGLPRSIADFWSAWFLRYVEGEIR
jgi:hypothetical protein